ncbi:hypothetical protein [Nocardiopsis valliformis]|uniref:hypothetical protein n=1 Tax=Nocardiopsis valliformis TaxID=239974 RepID=UPI001EFA062A|nr:hypothetical protein [Nocardiopsis valliformis]
MSIKFYDDSEEHEDNVGQVNATVHFMQDGAPQLRELNIQLPGESDIPFEAVRNANFETFVRSLSGDGPPTDPAPRKGLTEGSAKAKSPDGESRRPYRRMPDAEEVKKIFLRTESVGKLALHFEVPRYTAQAWVDRLRRKGALEAKGS